MASLEAAFQVMAKAGQSGVEKRPRLVANPSIGVSDVAKVFTSYCMFKQTGDLWSLVTRPPGVPEALAWRSTSLPCGAWIVKVCGLVYDLLDVCPNTKFLSRTVKKALQIMYVDKILTLPPHKNLDDIIDKIDLSVRYLLAMVRALKMSDDLQIKVYRMLGPVEKDKLKMTIAKIVLPKEYMQHGIPEDDDDDMDFHEVTTPDHLAVALYRPQSSPLSSTIQNNTLATAMNIFGSILKDKPTSTPSPPAKMARTISSSSLATSTSPVIMGTSAFTCGKVIQKIPSDEDLLASAQAHCSGVIKGTLKAKPAPKTKAKAKVQAKAKTLAKAKVMAKSKKVEEAEEAEEDNADEDDAPR